MSQAISGPYAGRILSDLGADVLRVDGPRTDVTELFGAVVDGRAGMYAQMNAGKRSIAVDLTAEGGTELIRDLAAQADVLIENFRPGVMDRLGLGYERLAAANTRLVMLSVSGFGPAGPGAWPRIRFPAGSWPGRIWSDSPPARARSPMTGRSCPPCRRPACSRRPEPVGHLWQHRGSRVSGARAPVTRLSSALFGAASASRVRAGS
jgi:hypothetical protein